MESKLLEAALEYSERFGYPIIPVNPENKKPLVKWLEFQNRKSTPDEIKSWWTKWPNAMIGGVTGKISNDFTIDIDSPVGDEALIDYIPDSLLTPTSITPRGGKHLHFEHPEEDITCKAGIFPHVDYRGQGGYICLPPSRNMEGKEYVWLDGLSLNDLPRAYLPGELLSYIKRLAFAFNKEPYKNLNLDNSSPYNSLHFASVGERDQSIFHLANCMVKGGLEENIAIQALNIIGNSCLPPFSEKECKEKIQSVLNRVARKERNLTEDLKNWIALQWAYFSLTQPYMELQILTSQKNTVHQIMHRFVEEGFVERHPQKAGCYRRVETSTDEIDFMGVEEKVFDIIWPFEIEQWVKILPKNIIVIAGEVNAGKTAFLLSTCFMNMGKFKINYFSSEMGAMELRDRLKKFEGGLQHWKENINFRERASNFADVVKNNDVNIIDFLEITEEFYKVAGMIKEIYDKLKKGIAIIALQKNPKTDFGLGGMRSVEKARLYLAIDHGNIKIVKGKNWASDVNPNGISRTFKLIQGAKFVSTSDWKREK